jgi:transposase
VAEVARRADVCTSLVYKWRREARRAASACGFVLVVVETSPPVSAAPPAASPSEPGVIVVEVKEARVRIGADVPRAVIAATLKALRS